MGGDRGADGGPHRVVALVNGPQSPFELAIASEVFGVQRPDLPTPYSFAICTAVPGPVPTTAGYAMLVERGLEALRDAQTVVVPGWEPTGGRVPDPVLEALVAAHARGARLLSICSGAFVLAQTGLLDGRHATTHWRHLDALAAAYPRVRVDRDVLYVDHGDVATSAGSAAGLDMCLEVVRADQGTAFAARTARHMVMAPHREGDQRQYAVRAARSEENGSLGALLEWAQDNLDRPLALTALADRVHLSPRTLDRRFREQLGVSPGRWLLERRVEAARELLETTQLTVEAVSAQVGLSSGANLRRRFQDAVGTTPAAYRRAFQPPRTGSPPPRGPSREGSPAA